MLRSAFNAVILLHSRAATLKRPGPTPIYSPCLLSPSNYFRFLKGPEYTTIKGIEFIIPLDSMTGQFAQKLSFSSVPDSGTYTIKFGTEITAALNFDADAATVKTAIRALTNFQGIEVTGNYSGGFLITMSGIQDQPPVGEIDSSSLLSGVDTVTFSWESFLIPWDIPLKKGDRVLDGNRQWTVDEIVEMNDLGAQLMGYRVRAD